MADANRSRIAGREKSRRFHCVGRSPLTAKSPWSISRSLARASDGGGGGGGGVGGGARGGARIHPPPTATATATSSPAPDFAFGVAASAPSTSDGITGRRRCMKPSPLFLGVCRAEGSETSFRRRVGGQRLRPFWDDCLLLAR